MANKSIFVAFLIVFLSISLIITIPVLTLSSSLSNYDTYDDIIYFRYFPSNASEVQKLTFYNEIGHVKIKYFEPNPTMDYGIMIEVNFEMSGNNLANKDYSDFFIILNESDGSRFNFTMKLKLDVNKLELLSLIKNITILVNLRADIVFDVKGSTIDGNVGVYIPYMVSIRNLTINTTKGDISYDFNNCIFEGNVTGKTEEGDLLLINNDVQCTLNVIWNLTIQGGNLVLEIDQKKEMGANITGTMVIPSGKLKLNYFDDTSDVGARFIFPLFSLPMPTPPHQGFETEVFKVVGVDNFGHLYKTTAFPSKYNFDLKFNLTDEDYDPNIISN